MVAVPSEYAFDDKPVLLNSPVIQGTVPLREVFVRDWWGHVAAQTIGSYRPLAALSLWADWRLGGLLESHLGVPRPWWMHLVNVLLHALAMVLVYRVMRRIVSEATAFGAALLCAVMAAPSEVVQGLVGCADLLETIGLVVGLWAHRKAGLRWATLACGCLLLALGTKETGILALLAWPAMEFFVPAETPPSRRLGRFLGYTGVAATYFLLRKPAIGSLQLPRNASVFFNPLRAVDAVSRIFGAGHIFLERYALGIVDPRRRIYDCSAQACGPSGPGDWIAWGGVLLFVAMVLSPLVLRRRFPAAGAGLAWVAIFLAPVVNFLVPATLTYGERLLYVPMIGLTIALAEAARRLGAAGWAGFAGAGLLNLIMLQPRHWDWRNDATLAASGLRYAADSVVVQEDNAAAATDRGDFAAAEAFGKRAIELVPKDAYAHVALAIAYAREGKTEPAEREFRESVALERPIDIVTNFANFLAKQGRYAEALAEVQRQQREQPPDPKLAELSARLQRALDDAARRAQR